MKKYTPDEAINKFWENVDKTPTCWNWKAGKTHHGYGNFVRGKETRAHRISWIMHFGVIPNGMCVCHVCDNPSCVRPDHLFLGTPKDNATDRNIKGRQGRSVGEHNASHKLTADLVMQIRKERLTGATYKSLANKYGVHDDTVRLAAIGKTWRHIREIDGEAGK